MKCERCGTEYEKRRVKPGATTPPDQGYCNDCVFTRFLKTTEPVSMLLKEKGIAALRDWEVRLEVTKILNLNMRSDAFCGTIDNERVISNWELPIKR